MHGCTDAWMHGCMDAWMHGCMDAWMHGCMDAEAILEPNKAQAGQWYLDRNFALQWENSIFEMLGAKSGHMGADRHSFRSEIRSP